MATLPSLAPLAKETQGPQSSASSKEDEPPLRRQPKCAARPLQRLVGTLALDNLDLDPLVSIMADVVLMSVDPCKRIADICLIAKRYSYLCDSDNGLYDQLNKKLGWYGEWGSLDNIEGYPNHAFKDWFMLCCDLYATYGAVYWYKELNGLGPVTLEDIESIQTFGEWLLNAIAESYKPYAKVADEIEKLIEHHIDGILDKIEKYDDATDLVRDDWYASLTYAVGAFGNGERFSPCALLEAERVLTNAMQTKPDSNDMPKAFYTIIYNSKELVKILRTHSPTEIKNDYSDRIQKLFFEASMREDDKSLFMDAGMNKITRHDFPEYTFAFIRELLITWLYLPELEEYVFDQGDDPARIDNDAKQWWGFFRLRKSGEQGIVPQSNYDEMGHDEGSGPELDYASDEMGHDEGSGSESDDAGDEGSEGSESGP
jgi:hypothetical protein